MNSPENVDYNSQEPVSNPSSQLAEAQIKFMQKRAKLRVELEKQLADKVRKNKMTYKEYIARLNKFDFTTAKQANKRII